MARPLRIEYPGACYHVMSRGNQRRAIVRDDADRHKRLDWLRRTVETYDWRLHAFVLIGRRGHRLDERTPLGRRLASGRGLSGAPLLWVPVQGRGRCVGRLQCRWRRASDWPRRSRSFTHWQNSTKIGETAY